MMRNKKIYIAGKVSGEDAATVTMKFGQVQKRLEKAGYTVINPLKVVAEAMAATNESWLKTPWEVAMKICITAMLKADKVYMLKDWQQSRGASVEHELAKGLNMDIIYDDTVAVISQCGIAFK